MTDKRRMLFRLIIFLFIVPALPAFAGMSDDELMRESWVKTLKSFLHDLEKKNSASLNLTVQEKHFLRRFEFFAEAWADSRYDCFYGGWPGTLVSSGGRRLCQSPKSQNGFSNSPCEASELRCQPLLFGPSLCAPFSSPTDRRSSFANCEKKFTERGASYDFLNGLSREEHENLRELSVLAGDICRSGSRGTQKDTPMCRELLRKLDSGLRSIDRAWRSASPPPPPMPAPGPVPVSPENCDEPPRPHAISRIAERSLDEMYETMKRKFEASSFCDPMNVVSNPAERPNPFLLRELARDMSFMELLPFNNQTDSDERITALLTRYHLGTSTAEKIRPLTERITRESLNSDGRRRAIAEMRTTLLQELAGNARAQSELSATVRNGLADRHIFRRENDGSISCPFVSRDAFMKAMQGRTEVLFRNGSSLRLRDQLTIVDYTRPSNERRLFVLDLNSLDVVHNTWVAHGGGNGNGPGRDGIGGSPEMSNQSGSNLSSDGFVIAARASSGTKFGPNVVLQGIDQNNSNLAARSVIIHGWSSPMDDYSNGVTPFDFSTGTYAPIRDPVRVLLSADINRASTQELEDAMKNVRSSTWVPDYLMPTEGCLGVPKVRLGHLDRRGRDKTELELLREDLPGSLIFNYSGPGMTSKYLRN